MSHESTLLRTLEKYIAGNLTPQEKERKKAAGEFEYIPLSVQEFETQCQLVRDLNLLKGKEAHFLDVGCGIGSKVWLARQYFQRASGVEITSAYVETAREVLKVEAGGVYWSPKQGGRGEIICADALTFNYAPYNIIYFYCPLLDYDKQMKLEMQIVKTAKVGTVFLANLKKNHDLWAKVDCIKPIWRDAIYIKV